jgi:ssDNA-binding replication factor A large subunit
MRVEELLQELEKKSGLSREELMKRIDKKISELDNLITVEGAIYLVARDLGIELPSERRRVTISSILPGMKRVNLIGRVFKISRIVEFGVGNKGRVVNLFVGDSTGYVKIPLWNDQVDFIDQKKVKIGSLVQVINGFAREGIFGETEVSLGKFGLLKVLNAEDPEIPSAEELSQKFSSFEKVKIKDIRPGNFEITGFIVKVFKASYVYNSNGEKAMVIPTLIDDGTGDIRVSFFKELAETLSRISVYELEKIEEEERKRFLEEKLLGREITVEGRVKKNDIYDRLEMIATNIKPFNPTEESYKLVEELENE